MGAERIEPGAELDVGILGNDTDIVAYVLDGSGEATKAAVIAEIPGTLGESSIDAPNAILVRKRFGGFLDTQPGAAGTSWSALGYAIYRSNNHFSGGPRVFSSYARRLSDLDLPIWQSVFTYDEGGNPALKYDYYPRSIVRPCSARRRTVFLNMTIDQFSTAVDPWVGAIFRFTQNGQPYILTGADGVQTNGAPLRAEYCFLTSGPVPAYPGVAPLYNDTPIPALKSLEEYTTHFVLANGQRVPIIDKVGPDQLYVNGGLVSNLPGLQ